MLNKAFNTRILLSLLTVILIFGTIFSANSFAGENNANETLSAEQIVQKASQMAYYQGDDGKAEVNMTIIDSNDRERKRKFTILRKNINDDSNTEQKFYVYFHMPADVNDTSFLVWKHKNQDDDRWLYLPALDLVKRIAAGDERTSFVGSDFFYEDVSGRSPDEDNHEKLESSDEFYVIKSTPKKPEDVEFAYYKTYIHNKTFLPIMSEYFDGSGNKYREYVVEEVKEINGYQTIVKSVMKDLTDNSRTILEYSDVSYNNSIPENIFSERYLRTPPKRYLR